ncbi:TPA: hypothetical protein ACH3X3_006650 [Trebouxia sp. C0006]
MSDADSAGSHSRASKASRSAGGRVAQVWKQFEAASALPSPSARTTVSAPQVPAAKSPLKTAGRKRKASQQRLAATAAVSPDASGSTPAAPPAKPPATSWRDVLMGNSPDDRHTIQALVAEVEQLKKLINNNRAQSDSQHDNCRQHRHGEFATDRAHAQIQQAAEPCCHWRSRELSLYHPRSTSCTSAQPAVWGCAQLSSAPCQLRLPLGQVESSSEEAQGSSG